MTKNKKVPVKTIPVLEDDYETLDQLPFAPPETHYLAERYIVELPYNKRDMQDRWHLRLYAAKVLENRLGDEVQLTSLKVKKPHIIAKSKAKLLKRPPTARLYVTVKF